MTEAALIEHPASSADQTLTRPGGGEAAAGSGPSQAPAARLIPDPFGLSALGGNLRLFVFALDGRRTLRVQLHGQAVDVEVDDDARDALVALLTRTVRR